MDFSIRSIRRRTVPKPVLLSVRAIKKNIQATALDLTLLLLNGNYFLKKIAEIVTLNSFESRKFEALEDCVSERIEGIECISDNPVFLSYSPPLFYKDKLKSSEMMAVTGHTAYMAVFDEAVVIGDSSIVFLKKKSAIYDIKSYDKNNRYRYTDRAIKFCGKDFLLARKSYSCDAFGEAIFLCNNYSWNYYHLLFEVMTRFSQINRSGIDINIPILVDSICSKVPQYLELLSYFNKDSRRIVFVNEGKWHVVNKLHYFSCQNFIPPNFVDDSDIQASDVLFDLTSLDYIRKVLLPLATKNEFPKRIYLSRSKASTRRNFNESEVIGVLEKYGFKMVHPEDYSVADQVSMFSNAEFIAGGSGAAFTNIVFCKKHCKVIVFSKSDLPFSGFSTIAKHVGAEMLYVSENRDAHKLKDIHDSFYIDVNNLNDVVSGLI
ncbi:MAG: glycosyltransferase 61 family protein [bacterium]|nr:glycosyltransferase 61 family protein [bacterium]